VDVLVHGGTDARLPSVGKGKAKSSANTATEVYSGMLLTVCRHYPGLPDPRTLTVSEIRFFYNGLRPELRKHSTTKRAAAK
jgi:hypothetical protein